MRFSTPVRTRSIKREKNQALKLGGRCQPNSGAGASKFKKGDIKTDLFLVEDKYTDAASFSLKLDVWRKINNEALCNELRPMMSIGIQGVNLYVIDEYTMKELRELLEAKQNEG